MDIQKKREEAFEDWFARRYPNIQKTIDLHNDHESIVFKNNQAEAWQAAKADSVPEGFVLVPKEPTLSMQKAGSAEAAKPNLGIVSMRDIYKAMLAASQEQK